MTGTTKPGSTTTSAITCGAASMSTSPSRATDTDPCRCHHQPAPPSAPSSAPASPTLRCPFKGVRLRSRGRWTAEIRIPRSREKIWLGSYTTAKLAARAYDAAYLLLHGSSAASSLNLSDSVLVITPQLARYTSSIAPTKSTIQQAAAEIAKADAGPGCLAADTVEEQETGRAEETDNTQKEWADSLHGDWEPLAESDEMPQLALQEALVQDGFTPLSPAVITRQQFDEGVASSSDALWSYEDTHWLD